MEKNFSQKSFVEDLWEKDPELVVKVIKNICLVNEKWGDKLSFVKIDEDGELIFKKTGRSTFFIIVNDFSIRTTDSGKNYQNSPRSIAWIKFMFSVYGDKYVYQLISHGNKEFDEYIEKLKVEHENQTIEILDAIGFEINKGQTK